MATIIPSQNDRIFIGTNLNGTNSIISTAQFSNNPMSVKDIILDPTFTGNLTLDVQTLNVYGNLYLNDNFKLRNQINLNVYNTGSTPNSLDIKPDLVYNLGFINLNLMGSGQFELGSELGHPIHQTTNLTISETSSLTTNNHSLNLRDFRITSNVPSDLCSSTVRMITAVVNNVSNFENATLHFTYPRIITNTASSLSYSSSTSVPLRIKKGIVDYGSDLNYNFSINSSTRYVIFEELMMNTAMRQNGNLEVGNFVFNSYYYQYAAIQGIILRITYEMTFPQKNNCSLNLQFRCWNNNYISKLELPVGTTTNVGLFEVSGINVIGGTLEVSNNGDHSQHRKHCLYSTYLKNVLLERCRCRMGQFGKLDDS